MTWMGRYDEEMFGKSNMRKRTKKEKREEKKKRIGMDMTENESGKEKVENLRNVVIEKYELDITAEEMKVLQVTTLWDVRDAVKAYEVEGWSRVLFQRRPALQEMDTL